MPSTYTLNNGIELIGTGEQSGTWGDTTNTNLQLLDTALDGQVTVALASAGSSGSPNNLPVSDGATSNGRNRLIIFSDSSDLGATAYVQLTPNDSEKIIYVRNSLSGSRSIVLFQGTYNASNDYEVPAGTTAVVFFNGAGTGAVAANVFNNAYFDSLRLGGVSVTAILDEDDMSSDSATALATQQSIKKYVDDKAAAQDTLAEVLANGNTTGGTAIQMTTTDELQFRDTGLKISSSADGQLDIDSDGTIDINATTSIAFDTDTLYVDSTNDRVTINSSGSNASGDLIVGNTTGGVFTLTRVSEDIAQNNLLGRIDWFNDDNSGEGENIAAQIGAYAATSLGEDAYLQFHTKAATAGGGTAGNTLTLLSDGTVNIANGGSESAPILVLQGDTDTGQWRPDANTIAWSTQGNEVLRFDSSQRVLIGTDTADNNIVGPKANVQIAGENIAPLLSVVRYQNNSSGPYVRIGKSRATAAGSRAIVQDGDGIGYLQFTADDGNDMNHAGAQVTAEVDGTPGVDDLPGRLIFGTTADGASSSTERMRISQNGDVDIGQTGGGVKLAVAGAVGTQNGSESAPTHTFYSDTDTGMYRSGANALGFTTGGSNAMTIDSSQRVLIGLTSDLTGTGHKLQVNDDITIMTFDGTTTGADGIRFIKSRASSPGSNTIVADGDDVGFLDFRVDDGTDYASRTAVITSQVDGTPGTNDTPGRLVFYTTSDGASSVTERMRIESTGTVNIGSVASNRSNSALSIYRLGSGYGDIRTSSNYGVSLKLAGASDNTDELRLSQDNLKNGYLYNEANAPLLFGVNNIERMRIQNDGVGIARSTLTEKFEVAGSINSSNQASNFNTGTYRMSMDIINSTKIGRLGTIAGASTPSGSEGQVTFVVNSAEIVRLTADGLTFNGDTAAANALDDYEEGTWVPTYQTGGTGFTSVTYDSPTGRYTKIGNVVHIQAFISTDQIVKGSASGNIQIGGLPFTAIANNGIDGFAAITISTSQDFAGNQPDILQVTAGNTYGELRYRSTSNGPLLAMQVSDMGTGLNDNVCYITGTYLSA